MSQENTRAPRLAFSTIEIVDLIKFIVVASQSSTRCKMSCGVSGGCDKSNIYYTIVLVGCVCLHVALDCEFLLVMGTSLIPRTQMMQA